MTYENEKDISEKTLSYNRTTGTISQVFKPNLVQTHAKIKVKVKPPPRSSSTEHHATKAHGGAEAQLHAFQTPALDGSERPAPRPGHPTPREKNPGNHCTESMG
jgi:hypothetical protein